MSLRFNNKVSLASAWELLCQAAVQRGQVHMVTGTAKAAFEAGWGAHRDAMVRVEELSKMAKAGANRDPSGCTIDGKRVPCDDCDVAEECPF